MKKEVKMEAKDTVMNDEEISRMFNLAYYQNQSYNAGISEIPCEPEDMMKRIAQAQAEISYKAGIIEGYNCGVVDGQATNHKRHGEHCRQARLAGMQKVVDWVNENIVDIKNSIPVGDSIYLRFRKPLLQEQWEAFLKKNGMEVK